MTPGEHKTARRIPTEPERDQTGIDMAICY